MFENKILKNICYKLILTNHINSINFFFFFLKKN